MKILETIRRGGETQRRLLRDNAGDILSNDLKMLHRLMGIAMLVLLFCLTVSLLKPDYALRRPAYIICTVCCAALCIAFCFKRVERYALVGLYCIFGIFLGLTVFLSVVVSPTVTAASIIGLLCLMPLAIVDREWRVNLIMALFYGIHILFSWLMKPPTVALDDTLNGFVFVAIGTLFGGFMRSVKLENYDIKRQM